LRQQHCELTVTDIDEIRAKLRSGDSTTAPSTGGWFALWVVVTCAIGFGAVFLGPRILGLGSHSEVQTSLMEFQPTESPPLTEFKPSESPPLKEARPLDTTGLKEFKPSESTPSFLRFGEELPKPPARGVVANYDGKSAADIGKIADQVCFKRAQTRDPYWGTTPRLSTQSMANFRPEHMGYFNELLRCLLTEGTRRYCLSNHGALVSLWFRRS
jgi:hypothetical protein